MSARVLALDGDALIHRSFHAATARGGGPRTHLAALVGELLERFDPSHLLVACDGEDPCFRVSRDAGYKADRPARPEGMGDAYLDAMEHFGEIGAPVLAPAGYEADDVLATLAARLRDGHRLTVATSDRDLIALVSASVSVYLVRNSGQSHLYTEADAQEVFGVLPGQVADYKALAGDSSDSISGVSGIGAKGACTLLGRFGSLTAALAAVRSREPADALERKLTAGGAAAEHCRTLTEPARDVQFELDADAARVGACPTLVRA